MHFVVDRSKWRCGDDGRHAIGRGSTKMKNEMGFMCCLGHCALALDDEPSRESGEDPSIYYRGTGTINPLVTISQSHGTNFSVNTSLSSLAIDVNDDSETTVIEKEQRLKSLFKEHGHTITFVGEPVPFH